jgi:FkbM family methyltransferase
MEFDLQTEKAFWLCTHEPAVQSVLQRIVRRGMTVYDVGAYIGFFSLMLARLCGADGRVFAFEPEPANFQRLKRHIDYNSICNVIALEMAVLESSRIAYLEKVYPSFDSRMAEETLGNGTLGDKNNRQQGTVAKVTAISLDDFVHEQANPAPDVIKIDVEGAESKVLLGAGRILKEARPIIVCETHGDARHQEVCQILNEHAYRIFDDENSWSKIAHSAVSFGPSGHMGRIIACHRDKTI